MHMQGSWPATIGCSTGIWPSAIGCSSGVWTTPANLGLLLATVLGYPVLVWVGTDPKAPVRIRNCQVIRPALSWEVCYPDRTETRGFFAGLNPDRGFIVRFRQLSLQLAIWVLIVSRYDQYADCAVLAALSPPDVRFAIGPIFIESLWNNITFRAKFPGFR